jgi:hypothetical protein
MSMRTPSCLLAATSLFALAAISVVSYVAKVNALTLTESGSTPVTALVLPTPPTTQAVINAPLNNSRMVTTPLVVSGTCGAGLLVRIINNGILAGSVICATDGTFIVNITLDFGSNKLEANNYDAYGQPGPPSPSVTVFVESSRQSTVLLRESPGAQSDEHTGTDILFDDTPFEPLAHTFGISVSTSPATNMFINIASQVVFVITTGAVIDTFLFQSKIRGQLRRLRLRLSRQSTR